MAIEPFNREDIGSFLDLAAAEGWLVDPWECDFLLAAFPTGCLCVRNGSGAGVAFVTAVRYEHSGWIGNLIVAWQHRGQGIGGALFLRTLQILREAGADTVWLTASKQGQSLYEKHGFKVTDTINRWSGTGRQRHQEHPPRTDGDCSEMSVGHIDCRVWGDRRDVLLAATIGRGTLLNNQSGFVVMQPCGSATQFGPFSALDDKGGESLLDAALCTVPGGVTVYLDAPASNRSALRLFNRNRMRITGTTELMYAGKRPDFHPEYLYGLATMGSCG